MKGNTYNGTKLAASLGSSSPKGDIQPDDSAVDACSY
jgi:hypothetical protein